MWGAATSVRGSTHDRQSPDLPARTGRTCWRRYPASQGVKRHPIRNSVRIPCKLPRLCDDKLVMARLRAPTRVPSYELRQTCGDVSDPRRFDCAVRPSAIRPGGELPLPRPIRLVHFGPLHSGTGQSEGRYVLVRRRGWPELSVGRLRHRQTKHRLGRRPHRAPRRRMAKTPVRWSPVGMTFKTARLSFGSAAVARRLGERPTIPAMIRKLSRGVCWEKKEAARAVSTGRSVTAHIRTGLRRASP